MEFYDGDDPQNANRSYTSPPAGYNYDQHTSYYDPNQYVSPQTYSPQYHYVDDYGNPNAGVDEEFEPPLLEELEIDLFLIRKRIIAIMDPFHSGVIMGSHDLAGPFFICLLFALGSFISGAKINFNHVYVLSVFSCLFMYILLSLMATSDDITLSSVTSILGYSLLPLALLSGLRIFINLHSFYGIICSSVAVFWCTYAATKMFASIGDNTDRKMLIAYPCILCYGVFTLCLMF